MAYDMSEAWANEMLVKRPGMGPSVLLPPRSCADEYSVLICLLQTSGTRVILKRKFCFRLALQKLRLVEKPLF